MPSTTSGGRTSTSTWRAPWEGAGIALRRGTDLECGDGYKNLADAVRRGYLSEQDLDRALFRVLSSRFRLGLFDPPASIPWAQITPAANDTPEHRRLALEAARESIVLLKNDGVLPLRKTLRTVAVVGPNADDVAVLFGSYNGWNEAAITPYAGIKAKLPKARVILARGSALTAGYGLPIPSEYLSPVAGQPGEHGLRAEYFANRTLSGEPTAVRVDENVDFGWATSPAPGVPVDDFSVRWTGSLTPTASGEYSLGFTGDDGFRVWLDGNLVVEDWREHLPTPAFAKVRLEAGRSYAIKAEYFQGKGAAVARLEWEGVGQAERLQDEAIAAAREAEVVIAAMGISSSLEGEELKTTAEGFHGGDRTRLGLPKVQQDLLEQLAATGKPVVLVLLSGSPLAVPWAAEKLPAIVQLWYPGEEGGTALADVLFGDVSPSGRLPLTFYKSVEQLPPFTDYAMDGRTYRFFTGEPLFPFGHGLSYTRFEYSALQIPSRLDVGAPLQVSVAVRNAGTRGGDEVVQLYVTHLGASTRVPIRSLQGLKRIHVRAGEQQTVSFALEPKQLAIVNDAGQVRAEPGRVLIAVGGKQPGFKGQADATTTQVVTARNGVGRPGDHVRAVVAVATKARSWRTGIMWRECRSPGGSRETETAEPRSGPHRPHLAGAHRRAGGTATAGAVTPAGASRARARGPDRDRQGPLRADLRLPCPVPLSRLVPRRQARHLGALGAAVGPDVRRLVRAAHVPPGPQAVPGPSRTTTGIRRRAATRTSSRCGRPRSGIPARLMALYKKAGARYFVSMGVHHDNFDLWDSKYHRWNAVKMGPHRDVVGDWQKAAKEEGLRVRRLRAPRRELHLVAGEPRLATRPAHWRACRTTAPTRSGRTSITRRRHRTTRSGTAPTQRGTASGSRGSRTSWTATSPTCSTRTAACPSATRRAAA